MPWGKRITVTFVLQRRARRLLLSYRVIVKPVKLAFGERKTSAEMSSKRLTNRNATWPEALGSKHQLHAADDFIELIVAEFRIGLAKIRPGVNVVDHQLQIVPVNVVIETAKN